MGTAAAADVITKTGNDYTIILDPNMTDDGTNVTNADGTVIYDDMSISGSVYLYSGPYSGNFSLAFDFFSLSTIPTIQLNVLDVAAIDNITTNLIDGYSTTPMNADFFNMVITPLTAPNKITLNGNNHEIDGRNIRVMGAADPEIVEIVNLNISNGSLFVQEIHSTATNNVAISNSIINNGTVGFSNITASTFSISDVTVSNATSGSDSMMFYSVASSIIITNTKIENGNLNSSSSFGPSFGPKNISITNLTLTDGNLNITTTNDTISNISVVNSDINGSFNLEDVNSAGLASNTLLIDVTNLTLTNGQIYFTDMVVTTLFIENSTVVNGQLNISDVGIFSSALIDYVYIFDSDFSNSAPGSELIVLGGSFASTTISNNKLTNGSLNLDYFGTEFYITDNTFSNTSHALVFGPSFGSAFASRQIYNNKFSVASGNNYILLDPTGYIFELNITPTSGSGLLGGPYVAGNYWSTLTEDGYSDGLAANNRGYSDVSYTVPTTGPMSFVDDHPLTKLPSSQGNTGQTSGSATIQNNDLQNDDSQNDDPFNDSQNNSSQNNSSRNNNSSGISNDPSDPNRENPNSPDEKKSMNDVFKMLENNNASTGEVIMNYIVPASVVVGAVISALLLLIVKLIDLFFDVTSEQVRTLAKEKTKYKLKFNPPKLSDIFKAQTAYMILLFIVGVCIIDTFLDEMVYAALETGLLASVAAIIPPIVIMATVNIGGGLFLDEVASYYLKKVGKYVNRNTSILDIIEKQKNINAIAFVATIFVAAGIVTFFVLFFGWTLV